MEVLFRFFYGKDGFLVQILQGGWHGDLVTKVIVVANNIQKQIAVFRFIASTDKKPEIREIGWKSTFHRELVFKLGKKNWLQKVESSG